MGGCIWDTMGTWGRDLGDMGGCIGDTMGTWGRDLGDTWGHGGVYWGHLGDTGQGPWGHDEDTLGTLGRDLGDTGLRWGQQSSGSLGRGGHGLGAEPNREVGGAEERGVGSRERAGPKHGWCVWGRGEGGGVAEGKRV